MFLKLTASSSTNGRSCSCSAAAGAAAPDGPSYGLARGRAAALVDLVVPVGHEVVAEVELPRVQVGDQAVVEVVGVGVRERPSIKEKESLGGSGAKFPFSFQVVMGSSLKVLALFLSNH